MTGAQESPQAALIRMLDLTPEQRTRKKDILLNLQGRSQKANLELFALKVASLRGKWVAVDEERMRCTSTARIRRPYRRLTVKALLEFVWIDGELHWTCEYVHECEYCAENKKGCKTYMRFRTADGRLRDIGFSHHGYDETPENLDLPRRGLSLDATPDFDDPAHDDFIFGWSKHEVEQYLRSLRRRRQRAAEAEAGVVTLNRGAQFQLRCFDSIVNDVGDAAAELTTSVSQLLELAHRQRHLPHADTHLDHLKRTLFERIVSVVRADPLLPLVSTTGRPTGLVVVLTDESTNGEVNHRLRDLYVPDAVVAEHFRPRPLPALVVVDNVGDAELDNGQDTSRDSSHSSFTVA